MVGGQLNIQGWEQVAKEADFSPARMATLCAISERQLQRIFKRHVQRTPSRWLRDLQCRLARELIEQGYSSKAAAAELKFSSESHFCREFKKVYGFPPQSFAPDHLGQLKLTVLSKELPELPAPPPLPLRKRRRSRPQPGTRV